MKVFIGGARQLHLLNKQVIQKLNNILTKNYDILVGDANGIDASVQKYYNDNDYRSVTVYASNGKARNNIGNWEIQDVRVDKSVTGFNFYAAKDLRMAQDADCGFMIWNGKSRGTWNNVINLCKQEKFVIVYISTEKKFHHVSNMNQVLELKEHIDRLSAVPLPQNCEFGDEQLRLF